jgi:hypothetical protein
MMTERSKSMDVEAVYEHGGFRRIAPGDMELVEHFHSSKDFVIFKSVFSGKERHG